MLDFAASQSHEKRKRKGLDEHPPEDTSQMLKMTKLIFKKVCISSESSSALPAPLPGTLRRQQQPDDPGLIF